MMKNKHLVLVAIAGLFTYAAVGCKTQIDVEETCKDIAHTTLLGTDSVIAGLFAEGCSMRVIEYRFRPGNKAERTEVVFGDGIYEPAATVGLTYQMADYAEQNAGIRIVFTPEDEAKEPYEALFFEGNLQEADYVLSTKTERMVYLEELMQTLPNTAWECHDTTLLVLVSSITYMDTVVNKTVTPGGVIRDTVITEKTKEVRDTLGYQSILDIRFSMERDAQTLANTGVWDYKYVENRPNDDSTGVVRNENASAEKHYKIRWGISSITTNQKLTVLAQTDSETEKEITLSFSKFRPAAGTTEMTYTNFLAAQDSVATDKGIFTLIP